VFFLSPSSQI